MQSLMSRIYNQIHSQGTVYYENYFYKESGEDYGRSRNGKSYIDKSVSLLIGGTSKGVRKNKTDGEYAYSTVKPRRCTAACVSCLECTFSDCMYDDVNRKMMCDSNLDIVTV